MAHKKKIILIIAFCNKSFDKIASKTKGLPEGEVSISSDMADHYAQKFDELYDMFNVRVGRK